MKFGGNRVPGIITPWVKIPWMFLKFILYSSSPTLYLSKSLTIELIRPELTKIHSMIKQGTWAYFKNHHYFSKFLHIIVTLHCTFSNHLQLCCYDQNWPTYEARGNGFSIFWFGPKKAASPTLLQMAIMLWTGWKKSKKPVVDKLLSLLLVINGLGPDTQICSEF